MKKLATIALCLLMVAALAVTVFAANDAKFSMSPSSKTLERGDQITLTVTLSNTNVADSYGMQLKYDKDVFEIVSGSIARSIKEMYLEDKLSAATFDAGKGFAFSYKSAFVEAYSGDFGTVTFKVKDNAPMGTYTITGDTAISKNGNFLSVDDVVTTITVSCSHSYGSWTNAGSDAHSKTCSKCGDVQTEAHKWNSGTTTKAATCEEAGVKTYTCSTCKATKTEAIAALGHKEGTGTQTKAPTCTEAGVKSFSCTRCNKVLRTEAINALGHKEDKGTVTKEATCKEEGIRTFSCTVCKAELRTEAIEIDENVHKFGNLTYVDETYHKDVCSICEQEVSLTHKWDDGKVTLKETCKDTGIKTYTCTGCKGTKTEVIPVNEDHKFDSVEYVDENNHNAICSVCDKAVSEAHAWDEGKITVKPTCQDNGEKTYTCAACEGTKVEVIEASEKYHAVEEWTITVQPTYESVGSREGVCTVCGETVVEELPKIDIPATGDNSKIILWSAILVLSACGLFATIFMLNDQKRKNAR